jgi:Hint domain/FG-GAP-like repeat
MALTFGPAATYAAGVQTLSVTTADLTGKGELDIVAAAEGPLASSGPGNGIFVLLNNGSGGFKPTVTYSVGSSLLGVTTADLSGSGRPDIIVADDAYVSSTGGGFVEVMPNNGSGGFLPAVSYAVGISPHAVATADLLGNGQQDVVVADYGPGPQTGPPFQTGFVEVLLNNGGGALLPPVTYAAGYNPVNLTTADLTGNGEQDIIVADYGTDAPGGVDVLLNNGSGGFLPGTSYAVGLRAGSVTTADLTGNGEQDIVAVGDIPSGPIPAVVEVLLNNGSGGFLPPITYTLGTSSFVNGVTTADLTGNGEQDIVVAGDNLSGGFVEVLLNNGSGGFLPPISYAVGTDPWSVTTADLDANGAQDIVVADAGGNPFAGFPGSGVEVLTNLGVVCFLAGTHIDSPAGEKIVESLTPGDIVLTLADGHLSAQPVKWVGWRRIDLTTHPRPETVAPVRIQPGAFADVTPRRDLLLSPDHAIFVDDKLICVRQLINGTTIRQETGWTSVNYFHVELDAHAMLLAEGLPAESYLDTGNRGFFSNSDGPLMLHPDLTDENDYPTREAGSCAPFVWDEASVQLVWQRLADRAAAIGLPVPKRMTTTEANLNLLAEHPEKHRSGKPVYTDSNLVIFVLPRGARKIRLLSRAQSPTEARPWLEDRRMLGVRVKRIVLRGANELREIPMDHPDLTKGWWDIERDGQVMSRWTNGDAVVPLPAMDGHVMLEVHLAGEMIYAVEAELRAAERRPAADSLVNRNEGQKSSPIQLSRV